ncbi:ABC transporter permease [Virgibacillus sp. W0181]|uniref:ABC transporter permease n=1 Tax=Virgibacillus sp. W0181 TaxID=3391581 RepID=UPI003F46CC08
MNTKNEHKKDKKEENELKEVKNGKRNIQLNVILPILTFISLYAVFEIFIRATGVPRIVLPTPTAIITETVQRFPADLWPHFLVTFRVIVFGFIIAIPFGIALAAVFSQLPIVVKATTPFIILLVVTPVITIVPLLVLWLGSDPNIRIIAVVVQATPIITLNTLSGFSKVETAKLELMKSIGASRAQTFFKVTFPNALPQVFTGIKLGCIFSTIGAISADFVAGNVGLGFRILQYSGAIMTEMVYGTILIVASIGIILYLIASSIEKRVIVWRK